MSKKTFWNGVEIELPNRKQSNEQPCGGIHPLPCGVDKDCEFIRKDKLRELLEEWQNNARLYDSSQRDSFNARCETYAFCADKLEELL